MSSESTRDADGTGGLPRGTTRGIEASAARVKAQCRLQALPLQRPLAAAVEAIADVRQTIVQQEDR